MHTMIVYLPANALSIPFFELFSCRIIICRLFNDFYGILFHFFHIRQIILHIVLIIEFFGNFNVFVLIFRLVFPDVHFVFHGKACQKIFIRVQFRTAVSLHTGSRRNQFTDDNVFL